MAPSRTRTVSEMARLAHRSPSRFHALYKECFGASPVEDLNQARLARARWLLTDRALSVGQVAEQCGFQSIYYFSQLFKRKVGCPPSQYYAACAATGRRETGEPAGL